MLLEDCQSTGEAACPDDFTAIRSKLTVRRYVAGQAITKWTYGTDGRGFSPGRTKSLLDVWSAARQVFHTTERQKKTCSGMGRKILRGDCISIFLFSPLVKRDIEPKASSHCKARSENRRSKSVPVVQIEDLLSWLVHWAVIANKGIGLCADAIARLDLYHPGIIRSRGVGEDERRFYSAIGNAFPLLNARDHLLSYPIRIVDANTRFALSYEELHSVNCLPERLIYLLIRSNSQCALNQ